MIATNSETSQFRSCQKRWWFEYVELLRTKTERSYFSIGSAYHAALAHGYLQVKKFMYEDPSSWIGDFPEDLLEHITKTSIAVGRNYLHAKVSEIKESLISSQNQAYLHDLETDFAHDLNILEWMVEFYWVETLKELDSWIPILIEYPFKVPIRDRRGRRRHLYHEGVLDLVVFDKNFERLVLVEHKTTSLLPYQFEDRFEFDPQCGGYLYAIKELLNEGYLIDPRTTMSFPPNTPIGSVVYDVIRRKVPSKPKTNKDGSVSVQKIDTLPEFYEAALKEQETFKGIGRSPKQEEILSTLQGRGHLSFFTRFEHMRPKSSIDDWVREQYISARHMRASIRNPDLIVRNEKACTMITSPACPFRSLCINDNPSTREMNFRIANSAHEEVDEARKENENQWLDL